MRRHTGPMIVGALHVLGVGCGEAPAPSAPEANYFAASSGARVIGSSRLGSPERMIDGSEAEGTGSSFGESGTVGSVVSVDVEAAQTRVGATPPLGGQRLRRRSLWPPGPHESHRLAALCAL